jgi:putative N6-adenine-specific DNA methylase
MDTRGFIYQEHRRFFAVVNEGLEELACAELERLGASDLKPIWRGVYFVASPEVTLEVLFSARLIGCLLAPLSSFDCHSSKYLLRRASQVPWETLLTPQKTFAVTATVANSKATHSQFVALKLKDAICDRMREAAGGRPDVDKRRPDLRVHIHLERDYATISADMGEGSRHRRGYRPEAGEAPVPETVAAALLAAAGWEGQKPLLDPMCGSGTILAEAVMRAGNIPAGMNLNPKKIGALFLPDFGREAIEEARRKAMARARPVPDDLIRGSDSDSRILQTAGENLARLPGGDEVRLRRGDFRDHPGLENGIIVCNPPWGIRLGEEEEAQQLVKEFGDWLKQNCQGSEAWLILGNRELVKYVGLKTTERVPVRIGALDGRFAKYELY